MGLQSGTNIDVTYDRTPEAALKGLLMKQPAFNTKDPEYIGERPEFMGVKAEWVTDHDWSQYEQSGAPHTGRKGGPPYIHERVVYDKPFTPDQRIRLRLSNVWLEVGYGDWEDEDRAEVKFHFSIQLRESELKGESDLRPDDHYWRCERMSTEPIH